eukprot:Colp12_sorted_trinity150504_noHs@27249
MSEHARTVRTLYRGILTLHRRLPEELRFVGNKYVREEFKLHKKADQAQTQVFMKEWTQYLLQLAAHQSNDGIRLRPGTEERLLDELNDEQVAQLYELYKETSKPRVSN